MQHMTSNGDMEDCDVMELKTHIDDNIHSLCVEGCGCDDHDLQPDDRVDDVLDTEGCDFCKEIYLVLNMMLELNLIFATSPK